MTRSELE